MQPGVFKFSGLCSCNVVFIRVCTRLLITGQTKLSKHENNQPTYRIVHTIKYNCLHNQKNDYNYEKKNNYNHEKHYCPYNPIVTLANKNKEKITFIVMRWKVNYSVWGYRIVCNDCNISIYI